MPLSIIHPASPLKSFIPTNWKCLHKIVHDEKKKRRPAFAFFMCNCKRLQFNIVEFRFDFSQFFKNYVSISKHLDLFALKTHFCADETLFSLFPIGAKKRNRKISLCHTDTQKPRWKLVNWKKRVSASSLQTVACIKSDSSLQSSRKKNRHIEKCDERYSSINRALFFFPPEKESCRTRMRLR